MLDTATDPQQQRAVIATRLVFAAGLLLCALATLAYQGRAAQGPELLEDAQQGRISWVLVTGDEVVWRTDALRPWRAELPMYIGGDRYGSADVPRLLKRYAPDHPVRILARASLLPSWLHLIWFTSGFAAFLLLVLGPAPWRANRWAWFWLFGVGRGVGVGALLFLLLSGPTPGLRRVAPQRPRLDGGRGFLYAIAISVALALLWYGVTQVLWPPSDGAASLTTPAV